MEVEKKTAKAAVKDSSSKIVVSKVKKNGCSQNRCEEDSCQKTSG